MSGFACALVLSVVYKYMFQLKGQIIGNTS
jgi:hypothetical protein